MTLPQHAYRDPLEILLSREAKSCAGCKFETVIWFGADKRKVCNSISKKWGRRCSAYTEKENKSIDIAQELPK